MRSATTLAPAAYLHPSLYHVAKGPGDKNRSLGGHSKDTGITFPSPTQRAPVA